MADAQFDVSHRAFQHELAELTEPGSRTNDLAVFAPQREERRFDVRALMVDRVILQHVVGDAMPTEFEMPDHRFDAFCAESLPKEPPVVAFVCGENTQFVEIPFDVCV